MFLTEEVQNGHGTSLDRRIADALVSEQADRAFFVALYDEAYEAIRSAQSTIETETEHALDLSNTNPDESDLLVTKARRTIARLNKAVPALKAKVEGIDDAAYRNDLGCRVSRAVGRRSGRRGGLRVRVSGKI